MKSKQSLLQVIYPWVDRPVNGHNGHDLPQTENKQANFSMQVNLWY